MSRPRFIVSSVTGCAIRPDAAKSGSSRPLPTSYYVLDRDGRRRLAEAKAAELNAWDEHGA